MQFSRNVFRIVVVLAVSILGTVAQAGSSASTKTSSSVQATAGLLAWGQLDALQSVCGLDTPGFDEALQRDAERAVFDNEPDLVGPAKAAAIQARLEEVRFVSTATRQSFGPKSHVDCDRGERTLRTFVVRSLSAPMR
jgi:hypothetical protein